MKQNIFKSIISLLLTVSILLSLSASFFVYAESNLGYINSDNVRVRTTPSTNDGDNLLYVNDIALKLLTGHSVTVLDTVDGINGDTYSWSNIEFTYGGKTYKGYVASQYVSVMNVTEGFVMPDGVPEIYKPYIEQLLILHPNWNFVFYDTGYNWNDLFSTSKLGQCYTGRSLMQNPPLSYRSTASDCYNWREDKWIAHDGSSWYQANKEAIAYYMDPRNFLYENTIFMFEQLSYDSSAQNIGGVKSILKNSFMNNKYIKNLSGNDVLYAQAYIDAAAYSNVSPYHLSSRTIQEVSNSGSGSTSGNYGSYAGYYNFYNIGASAGADPVANGLNYAKTGGSMSAENKAKCYIPWNTPYKSIVGGAYWIGMSYINSVHKQNTLYYQKFNTSNSDPTYFYHQYMTNIMAPSSEAPKIKNSYTNLGVLDNNFTFIIPYYRNMPNEPCQLPVANNYNPNNWLKTLTVQGYSLDFDSAKTDGYTLAVPKSVSSVNISGTTINSKAKITGGVGQISLKDGNNIVSVTVKAENGNVRTYTLNIVRADGQQIPMTGISLNTTSLSLYKDDSATLSVSYQPSNTTYDKSVIWTSSNPAVATVSNGKVTGVGRGETTITAQVGSFKVYCKVSVSADIILGDIDADNSVTIADALLIFKYKTGEISSLSNFALLAADTDISGKIELSDALRIFKFKSGEIDSLHDSKGHWVKDSIGWCYLDSNGRWLNSKWAEDSVGWCYLDSTGHMAKNKWAQDSIGWCYIDSTGHMVKDVWLEDTIGWCYIDSTGHMVKDKWIEDDVGWCYLDSNGHKAKNKWVEDSVGWCYLDSTGHITKDKWIEDSFGWCYVDSTGYMVKDKWIEDDVGWCYLDSNGHKAKNKWVEDSVGWCYLDSTGHITKDKWIEDSFGWCYVDSTGYMVKDKWIKDSVGWCYIDSTGHTVKNKWIEDTVTWCYLDDGGHMVVSNWVEYNEKWYYMDENGHMVTGTKVINGKTYEFDSNGVWIG